MEARHLARRFNLAGRRTYRDVKGETKAVPPADIDDRRAPGPLVDELREPLLPPSSAQVSRVVKRHDDERLRQRLTTTAERQLAGRHPRHAPDDDHRLVRSHGGQHAGQHTLDPGPRSTVAPTQVGR